MADALYLGGGSPDPSAQLKPYFSGPYLNLLEMNLRQYHDENLEQTGAPQLAALVFRSQETQVRDGLERAQFEACLDFSDVAVKDAGGEVIERGFDLSIDTVDMVREQGGEWKAHDVSSRSVDQFEGTGCAGDAE
ncbi:hypothetical protein SAMN04489747_0549 [Auraticoccus monumenti]|uniref:Uncharacterized protein n=1 Tax=Auraticoccus monumenti TaxID=675864 RepID=A0A1G6T7U6_9ACTN|nr:hypothetical protein SAMN04489747_0549 [Auraticoccus monumenti]